MSSPLTAILASIGTFVSVTTMIILFLDRSKKSGGGEAAILEQVAELRRRMDSTEKVTEKHTDSLGSFAGFVAKVEEFMRSQVVYNTRASEERHDMNTRLSQSEGREEGRKH